MTISKEERAELRADIRANCYPDVSGELTTLLDALDASDERIAELEAIWKLREKEHELATRMVNRRNEELKEAKSRIAELEAAAQWRPMDTAPRDGTEILVLCHSGARSQCELAVWEGHSCNQWIGDASRYDEDQVSVWLPIPALPEGGAK